MTAPRIAEIAAESRLVIHELTPVSTTLEEAYMELTRDEVEYTTTENPSESTR
jgi:ABC-2 type transport system ATP-binding protein